MKKIIVFNGIQSSGKSTIAQLFAKQTGEFVYYSEIGGRLREEVQYNVLDSGEVFDREVMRRELERDKLLLDQTTTPVVETWHIGNLAYALVRNPDVYNEYQAQFNKQLKKFEPVAVYVDINWDVFKKRSTANVAPHEIDKLIKFYDNFRQSLLELYNAYEIPVLSITNNATPGEALNQLKLGLYQIGIYGISNKKPVTES